MGPGPCPGSCERALFRGGWAVNHSVIYRPLHIAELVQDLFRQGLNHLDLFCEAACCIFCQVASPLPRKSKAACGCSTVRRTSALVRPYLVVPLSAAISAKTASVWIVTWHEIVRMWRASHAAWLLRSYICSTPFRLHFTGSPAGGARPNLAFVTRFCAYVAFLLYRCLGAGGRETSFLPPFETSPVSVPFVVPPLLLLFFSEKRVYFV